jgi:hypothetical protein
MIATTITITEDTATPALLEKLRKCDPHIVATRIAPPIARHWRDHLASLPHNRNGYPSTGFWEAAARSVTGIALGDAAKISADKLGLRQRLYGGTITASKAANITIPICAEAYGTTVADWGFENLVLVILSDGRKFLALWQGWSKGGKLSEAGQAIDEAYSAAKLKKLTKHAETTAARVGRFWATNPGDAKKPNVIVFRASGSGSGGATGEITRASRHANLKFLFVLKPSVEQAGNPNVLPPDLAEFAMQQVEAAAK